MVNDWATLPINTEVAILPIVCTTKGFGMLCQLETKARFKTEQAVCGVFIGTV